MEKLKIYDIITSLFLTLISFCLLSRIFNCTVKQNQQHLIINLILLIFFLFIFLVGKIKFNLFLLLFLKHIFYFINIFYLKNFLMKKTKYPYSKTK